MSQTGKTTTFVVIAAVLMSGAIFVSVPRSATVDDFKDQGQPFFADFLDPSKCTSLEVVEVDPKTAEAHLFKVMQQNGRWVIPSHYDYPADAKDRLARTAAQVMDLTKDTIRSSRSEDHALLGVLDPLDMKSGDIEGLGKRISLKDQTGSVLAEYIIGKEVPNRPGQRYVRVPGQVRTYGVNLKAEVSVQFADWIEPNLLELDQTTVRQVTFDNRKVDPNLRRLIPGDLLSILRESGSAPWTLASGLAADEEVDPTKTSSLLQALADLKIVGIRPKPPGLAAALAGEKGQQLDTRALRSLNAIGFYPTEAGMLSDEGTVLAHCSDGVLYKLQFGRVNYAQGEALTAGKNEDGAEDQKAANPASKRRSKSEGDSKDQAVESRFLFVTVALDPTQLPKPKEPIKPEPGQLPKNVFSRTGAEIQAESARYAQESEEWTRRTNLAKTRVNALSKRFAPWYYLVPGDDYRSLVLDRKQLIRPKSPDQPPGNGANPFAPNRNRPLRPPFAPPTGSVH